MGHDHEQEHGPHTHTHGQNEGVELPTWADPTVPESELDPSGISRRNLLRSAGLLGGGAAAMSVLGSPGVAAASTRSSRSATPQDDPSSYVYLAGDHHIHTQFSSDAMYRPHDQAFQAAKYGLDWIVITDHGSVGHAKFGVDLVNPDIRSARAAIKNLLVFQGLEWNIPAAEHATIIVTPGDNEVSVLRAFENGYDGVVKGATVGAVGDPATPGNELLAIQGLQFLAGKRGASDGVDDVVMLANHPARKGIDSPHEFRAWRDQGQGIAIGMEGAPGHQNGGVPNGFHTTGARGEYAFTPSAQSWPAYTTPNFDYYRTWGGFDSFTAMVGGLWDSLLSEGRPWWITANSDSHKVLGDPFVNGPVANRADGTSTTVFDESGRYLSAVEVAQISAADGLSYSDFFPGAYSRNHVGATRFGYAAVLAGLRSGNAWVDHGQLVDDVQVRVKGGGFDMRGVTLGGTLRVRKGADVELTLDITPAQGINNNGDVPHLSRVDVIRGLVTGPTSDQDTLAAPNTSVVKMFDVSGRTKRFRLSLKLKHVSAPFYLRLRGTDGNRLGPGFYPNQDPSGPAMDVIGAADPWKDLWFYTNPIFVDVR
jgi:hypothetical protein